MNTAKPYVLGPMESACPHKSPRSILLTLDAHIAAHTGIAHTLVPVYGDDVPIHRIVWASSPARNGR